MFRTALSSGFVVVLASTAHAETPLQKALNAPTEGPKYSFDMSLEEGDMRAEGRIDPSQPEGSRVRVTSPPESEWDDDFRKAIADMDKNAKGDIWCSELAEMVPMDAELESETDTRATYTFQPVATDKDDEKVFKHLTGRVTVSKIEPGIESFHMTASKPFKPVMVAKIESFNMSAVCTPGPDGRHFVSRMEMKVSGKAMMKAFDEHQIRTVSNLQPITTAATGAP